ncbi:MAG TPA: hypothetical protein PLC65_15540, partial [Bacteroidia bacterium]|nr:hypothetical protein [Bacteroidia bacterium]
VLPFLVIIPLVGYVRNKINVKIIVLIVVFFVAAFYSYKLTKVFMFDKEEVKALRIYQYFENPLYFKFAFIDRISAGLNSLGFYILMLVFPMKMACYYG